MSTIVLRHIPTFDGSVTASSVTFVNICRVFNRLHIRFIEAPRATARKRLAKSPKVIKVSRIVKDVSRRRMKAKLFEIYLFLLSF